MARRQRGDIDPEGVDPEENDPEGELTPDEILEYIDSERDDVSDEPWKDWLPDAY